MSLLSIFVSRYFVKSFIALFLFTSAASAPTFTMNESFLRTMVEGNTIQPTFRVRINVHGPLHALTDDCEMHVAGTVQNASLGTPSAIVVEFPNWCKFNPDGQLGDSFDSQKATWDDFATTTLDTKTCDVKGFLRIFTKQAQGPATATNPNHVYEFHPALSMKCGSNDFSFGNMSRISRSEEYPAFKCRQHIRTRTLKLFRCREPNQSGS